MGKLGATRGKRDKVGGPITKFRGIFSPEPSEDEQVDLVVTDCFKTVVVRTYAGFKANVMDEGRTIKAKTGLLNPGRDWYVFARGPGASEVSNAVRFPANGRVYDRASSTSTAPKHYSIKTVKRRLCRDLRRAAAALRQHAKALMATSKHLGFPYNVGLENAATGLKEHADFLDKLRQQVEKEFKV